MKENKYLGHIYTNVWVNILLHIVTMMFNLVSRIIFLKIFGEVYMGINGLFTNILSVLSIAELGIGGSIIYSLYEPLAKNDQKRISELISYFKKLYECIGIVVAVIGISILPFLKYLINLETPIKGVHIYYLLFLSNSVASYFCVYKTSLFTADQKEYKKKIINIIFLFLKFIVQTFVAVVFRNFTIYLATQIFMAILDNVVVSKRAEKEYPYIKTIKSTLDEKSKKDIWKSTKAMATYQIGGMLLNHTDNILISIIVGTVTVGFYSNYLILVVMAETFISLIFNAIQPSIGHFNVESNKENLYRVFNVLQIACFWLHCLCAVAILVLLQDFIKMLFGAKFLLGNAILLIIVINFYIRGILNPIYCYRNTTGMFKETKGIMLITAVLNLILSVILGKYMGLFGILAATAISRLLTNAWYEPFIIYKRIFKQSFWKYIFQHFSFIVILGVISVLTIKITNTFVCIDNIFFRCVLKAMFTFVFVNGILLICFFRKSEFKYLVSIASNFLGKFKK